MDESSVELAEGAKATERVEKTPEELVAKAIAPVKREFLCPPPVRPSNDVVSDSKSMLRRKEEEKNVEGEKTATFIEWESWLYIKQPYSNRKIENKGIIATDQF